MQQCYCCVARNEKENLQFQVSESNHRWIQFCFWQSMPCALIYSKNCNYHHLEVAKQAKSLSYLTDVGRTSYQHLPLMKIKEESREELKEKPERNQRDEERDQRSPEEEIKMRNQKSWRCMSHHRQEKICWYHIKSVMWEKRKIWFSLWRSSYIYKIETEYNCQN